jgi:hypothetical protein
MGLIDVQRQILSLCFDATPSEETLESLGERDVWLTYREMIRERLMRELRLALPRTYRLAGAEVFEAAFAYHLQHDPPRTRFFREVVSEFVATALQLWAADTARCDLARYELALWEVRDLDAAADIAPSEFSFERVALMSRALRLLSLSHAVRPGDDLGARQQFLCIARASDAERAKVFSLTPTTFQLLQRLVREDNIVSDVVKQLATASGARIDAAYLDKLCETLAQFLEVGIILGSR